MESREARIAALRRKLAEQGYRITPQRLAVVGALAHGRRVPGCRVMAAVSLPAAGPTTHSMGTPPLLPRLRSRLNAITRFRAFLVCSIIVSSVRSASSHRP